MASFGALLDILEPVLSEAGPVQSKLMFSSL